MGSFLSHSKSIFQYAYKEAQQLNKLSEYQTFLANNPIVGFFKELRDIEIHDSILGKHTVVSMKNKISLNTDDQITALANVKEDQNKPDMNISLSKKLEISKELINRLTNEGRKDLFDAIADKKSLYEEVTFNGETDIFELIDKYVNTISEFIEYGVEKHFIT